ncbi:MAG: hypothetical protein ABSE84_04695 [Isosphaeraceae bacterium]|jgi:hypothetical protein
MELGGELLADPLAEGLLDELAALTSNSLISGSAPLSCRRP